MTEQILLIDDDASLRRVTEFNLEKEGYRVLTAANGAEGIASFKRYRPALVITDVKMPEIDGYEVLNQVLELEPETLVVMVTAFSSIELAVTAMKNGAYDYVTKPFSRDQLNIVVAKALQYRKLQRENSNLKETLGGNSGPQQIIGTSRAMQQVMQRVARVAPTNASVLINGESGTGKEVIAKALNRRELCSDPPKSDRKRAVRTHQGFIYRRDQGPQR